MSTCIACVRDEPRASLSRTSTTAAAVIAAMTLSASGAAPTPLYHQYQESFGLTPFMVTIIFAAYVLSLLTALLTVGSLSDYIGRRPAIFAALTLNIAAMAMFMGARSRLRAKKSSLCRQPPKMLRDSLRSFAAGETFLFTNYKG